ncbi:MAG: hypothetical protein ACE5IK_08540 [Acidobacteriota bacterium]
MPASSMEVTAGCPLCQREADLKVAGDGRPVICPHCQQEVLIQLGDIFFAKGTIDRCVICGETHLYRQRDFSQRAGCAILGLGAIGGLALGIAFGIWWLWGVLLVIALLDAVLYRLIPDVIICYRCKAHYRKMTDNPDVGPFDLQLADAIEGRMGGGLAPPEDLS